MQKILTTLLIVLAVLISGCQREDEDARLARQLDSTPQQQHRARIESRIAANYQDADAHYQLGKIFMEDRLLTRAEYQFSLAIGFNPVHRRAQAAHVKTYKMMGDESKARQLAEIYMRQVNSRAEDALLLGRAFQSEGLDDYALACFERALTIAPDSAVLNKQIGLYYLNKGDKARAESYLRRSIQINPYQPDVAGELGRMGVKIEVPTRRTRGSRIDALDQQQNEGSN